MLSISAPAGSYCSSFYCKAVALRAGIAILYNSYNSGRVNIDEDLGFTNVQLYRGIGIACLVKFYRTAGAILHLTPLKVLATVSELCRGLSQVSATRPATGWRCRAAGPWLAATSDSEAAPMADS